MLTLTDTIRSRLESCPIPIYKLAEFSGVPQPCLSRFMNGVTGLSLRNAERLCLYWGLELRVVGR